MAKRQFLLGIVFTLCAMIVPGQLHVQHGNLWDRYLCRNAEHLLILFKNGELVIATENLENKVAFPWSYLFEDLGYKPDDILVVIHNHLGIGRWTESDKKVYHRLREAGFRGFFGCRLGSGKVIWFDK